MSRTYLTRFTSVLRGADAGCLVALPTPGASPLPSSARCVTAAIFDMNSAAAGSPDTAVNE